MQIDTVLSTPGADAGVAPRLLIGRSAWLKMRAYALEVRDSQGYNVEINGFGYVERLSDGSYWCGDENDVFITKQIVTAGAADTADRAHAKAEYHAIKAGRAHQLRMQWHSHVWGRAYHSSTDKAAIENYGPHGVHWFISVVINNDGKVTARFDLFKDFRIGAPMEVILVDFFPDDLVSQIRDEIDERVTVKEKEPVKGGLFSAITRQS